MTANGSKSKRRSVASYKSKPRKPAVFFLDRSLGKRKIAAALRQAGVEVQVHDDHFAPDERDEDWLREVGERGWIVLTKDHRIRYRELESTAILKARACAFVLTGGNLQGEEMGQIFVKALPAIKRFMLRHPPPFIAKVTRAGSVSPFLSAT